MSGAGGDWESGGEWTTVMREKGREEEASEVPVLLAVFVCGWAGVGVGEANAGT
jgi:hypothetical protein